jgi:hypothetical protein
MRTPASSTGVRKFDHLSPAEAVQRAWLDPGNHPDWHRRMQERVRLEMPVLARALDRLAKERVERAVRLGVVYGSGPQGGI